MNVSHRPLGTISARLLALAVSSFLTLSAVSAPKATPERMIAACRNHAHDVFRLRHPDIETKYEGRRSDGTFAVNGTAWRKDKVTTFQCSFDKTGHNILKFVIRAVSTPEASGDAKFAGTDFNATGNIPCAQFEGQPAIACQFGVKRRGNGNGALTIFWPDGGTRVIFFENNAPVSYDGSEADAGAQMAVSKTGDLFRVEIGEARFEIPDVVFVGD